MSPSQTQLNAAVAGLTIGAVLDKQLEDWLGKADLTHTSTRAITALYPIVHDTHSIEHYFEYKSIARSQTL